MRWIGALLAAAVVFGQSPQTYRYQGRPLAITGSCKADELGTLGLSCTAWEPCGLFLELSDVEPVGKRLIVTGNLHTGAITVESILLSSEDDGLNWTEPMARIPAAVLDQVQFADFANGWISGHLMLPRPRDPFFLLSTDGGKVWRRRPISGEPGPGVVAGFQFDTRQRGLTVLDRLHKGETGMRYEVYESMTGGDGWMLQRVTDRPVTLKTPDSPGKTVRIRVDKGSSSYRIERRSGETWSSVAGFAIAAGECRLQPAEPQAPPPSEEVPPPHEPAVEPLKAPSLRKKGKP